MKIKSQPKQNYAMKYQSRNNTGRTLSDKEIATYGCCILEVIIIVSLLLNFNYIINTFKGSSLFAIARFTSTKYTLWKCHYI